MRFVYIPKQGVDQYTVLLLHMNGADASTSFIDETGKTMTAVGGAQIDTARSKLGGAAFLGDGSGDYLTAVDSIDWQLDGGADANFWTIDMWVRFNGDPGTGTVGLIQQRTDNSNWWSMYLTNNQLSFTVDSAASIIIDVRQNWNPADATWYHVALVKNGTTGYMHFIDGTQVGSSTTDTSTLPNFTGGIQIGRHTNTVGTNSDINGWIDELRVSKGIARWTANFTPPTTEY